jgi:hypothetical protein
LDLLDDNPDDTPEEDRLVASFFSFLSSFSFNFFSFFSCFSFSLSCFFSSFASFFDFGWVGVIVVVVAALTRGFISSITGGVGAGGRSPYFFF